MRVHVSTALLVSLLCLGVTVQGQRQVFPGSGQLPFSAATKADGLIYVSGALAAKGDIKEQTQGVLNSLGQTSDQSRLEPAECCRRHRLPEKCRGCGGDDRSVARHLAERSADAHHRRGRPRVAEAALVEIAVIAVPNGGERKIISPAGWSTANPYSHAIQTGDTLFISGLVSRNAKDNQPIEGDVTTQVKAIFANAEEILKTAGFTMADVVANRVYLTDVQTFGEMNKAYIPNFPKNPPARATVIVGLPGPTYKVEVTMTAVKGAEGSNYDACR